MFLLQQLFYISCEFFQKNFELLVSTLHQHLYWFNRVLRLAPRSWSLLRGQVREPSIGDQDLLVDLLLDLLLNLELYLLLSPLLFIKIWTFLLYRPL